MRYKLLIFFVVVLFLFVAGETMAASKPPAQICLRLDPITPGMAPFMALMVKSVGSVKMVNGPTNIYAIKGFIFTPPGGSLWDYPLSGTGHMYKTEDGIFHFSVVGSTMFVGTFYTIYMEGYWNVVEKKGGIFAKTSGTLNDVTTNITYTFNLSEVSCETVEIP